MRIAIACDSVNLQYAGSLVSTWRYATKLAEKGHKVVLISTGKKSSVKTVDGVKIVRFKAWTIPGTDLDFWMSLYVSRERIRKILKEERIQLVHCMIPTPLCLLVSKVAKKLNIPLIAHSHTQPENILMSMKMNNRLLNTLFYKYLVKFYSMADVIVCPTRFAKEKLRMHGLKKKTVVISNGVDLNKFKINPVPESFYREFGLNKGKKHILFVGRLWREKNIATLIKAMPYVLKRFPSTHLDIVGKKSNQYSKLKQLVDKLDITDNVTFLGKINDKDLVNAYNMCDIFCLPSYVELEGMVVLEAMACGKPIIISNSSESASKYYVDGNGYLTLTTLKTFRKRL
jgi:1,2-diacylglycerol 3-alpha-glucosyltransferase